MTRIQLRRGTAAQWTSANPVLADGEMGIETDTKKFKFGNGIANWNSLDYVITGEVITDYTELDNLPSINNITLTGNKSASDLGLQEELIKGTGISISGTTISVDDSVVAMLSDIPDVSNFVTNSSLSVTLQDYQLALESGTNIKTINNQSLLGSGNIEIQSGGTYSEGTGIDITNGVISVDTNTVALKSDIPSLTGYATQTWVQNQNYLTSISSSDVISALGYTPYSSANPNNYTSNIGTVTSVNGTQPDSNGNVSITIPDSTTFMDLSTNQTAYGTKTFNDLRVNQYIRNSSGKMIFGATGSLFSMGDTTCELVLDGSRTRPKYYNGTTNTEIALLSDIPTVPTVDQTYNSASTNPQSGTAVEEAINTVKRNIGELVYSSLPLTDAGLHLLDGALISGSGSYSDFVDYIADLYTNNPTANYFTDETTWQNSVTTYGVCGKFVYDSTNNTVRLPKVTGIIEGTIDTSTLGDLVEAGLPIHTHTRGDMNITASFDIWWSTINAPSGAFYGSNQTSNGADAGGASGTFYDRIGFDASRSWTGSTSNPNYTNSGIQNSSTVQPQTIKCFVYIVIANSTKTDIQVDIDEIATDLNGKADVDLSNTTDQAKILMSGMGMPSNTYINLTLGASGTQYTAPADGYILCIKGATGENYQALILGLEGTVLSTDIGSSSAILLRCWLPVAKGSTFYVNYTAAGSTAFFRFIYAQGSESEAN